MTGYGIILGKMKELSKKNCDLCLREFSLPPSGIPCALFFFEGVVDKNALQARVLDPILQPKAYPVEHAPQDAERALEERFLCIAEMERAQDGDSLLSALFHGAAILVCAALEGGFILRSSGGAKREPSEPVTDRTISGPREGFVESFSSNLALVRRKITDPALRAEKHVCGRRTRTDVALLYMDGIADPEIVCSVRGRLSAIDIDGILASGYVGQLTETDGRSVFPTYRLVERTDIAAAALLEGRVVLICDQSPLVITLPTVLAELLQAGEDYYEKPTAGTAARILRWSCFFFSLSLPSLYISLVSFRPEILPYDLLAAIAAMRAEVPFPALAEVLMIEFAIQIIIECSLRLPVPLGQTIGVVSGIIVGQAIISAKLATPLVLIVVAVANICNFAIPNYSLSVAVRILRPAMLFCAALFGLFGFSLSWSALLLHLLGLKSVGKPYMAPFAPDFPSDRKDGLVRRPLLEMILRPRSTGAKDPVRQAHGRERK